jgi:hypothetical protein
MEENKTAPMLTKKRKKWLRIASYIALPVFGMMIGSGFTLCFMRSAMQKAFTMSSDEIVSKITSGISSRYDLDTSQRSAVHGIAKTRIENMMRIRDETRPRIVNELQAFRGEVGEVLGEEQGRRWDRNFGWMLSRWPFPTTGEAAE